MGISNSLAEPGFSSATSPEDSNSRESNNETGRRDPSLPTLP